MRIGLGGIVVGALGLWLIQKFTGAFVPSSGKAS